MKLQIIELEHFDDRVSAAEKLSWVRADRVLLIWPDRGEILTEKLDLRLLQRKARGLRLALGLISHHPAVRRHAADLGIPTFDDPDHLPEKSWRESNGGPQPIVVQADPVHDRRAVVDEHKSKSVVTRPLPEKIRRLLAGLGLASIVMAALAIAPRATVIVSPELRTIAVDLEYPVEIGPGQFAVPGLPGQRRVVVTVAGEHRIPTFTGPVERGSRPSVTDRHLAQVQDELEAELIAQASGLVNDQLAPSERLLDGSVLVSRVISRTFDASVGDAAATVAVEMELEVSALVLDEAALGAHAQQELHTAAPRGWVGVPGSLEYELIERDRRGAPYLVLSAAQRAYRPRELGDVAGQIRGMPVDQAADRVRALLDVRDVSLEVWPTWLPWSPIVPARIEVSYPWDRG